MPSEQSDISLLRNRDTAAWDAFYMATCRRTYRVLYQMTGADACVLEELNQEVWLSAIESIEGLDLTRGAPHDWILGIARFKGLSYLRKQYGSRVVFVGSGSDLPERLDAFNRRSEAEMSERMAVLRASIESLPEAWQQVLRQKYEAGMSVKDISSIMGSTPKAIESILSRARQRLREIAKETLYGDTN